MKTLLLVGAAGALGSVARYSLSLWAMRLAGESRFPFGTFAVNILGCLAAGLLAALASRHPFVAEHRAWIFGGLLGGFTTFSAFGLETLMLLNRGDTALALLNVLLSVSVGLLAVWAGMAVLGYANSP